MTLREQLRGATGSDASMPTPEVLVIAAAPADAHAIAPLGRPFHADTGAFVRPVLVATGPDPLEVDAVLDALDAPAGRLLLADGPSEHWAEEAARMVLRLDALLDEARPAAVVVRGGSEAALAATRSAVRLGVPVVHLVDPLATGFAGATQAAIAELVAWQNSAAGGVAHPIEIDLHVRRCLHAAGAPRGADAAVVRMPSARGPHSWRSA